MESSRFLPRGLNCTILFCLTCQRLDETLKLLLCWMASPPFLFALNKCPMIGRNQLTCFFPHGSLTGEMVIHLGKIVVSQKARWFLHTCFFPIATPHTSWDPKWWFSKGNPLFQRNLGWWNIIPFGQMSFSRSLQIIFWKHIGSAMAC